MMKEWPRFVLAVLTLAAAVPVAAQELWMLAQPFAPAVGSPVMFTLHVGEHFSGELLPFATAQAAALQLYTKASAKDLLPQLPADKDVQALTLNFDAPGTIMLAYDTLPKRIDLSAERFHAHLHEEGLDAIIRQREKADADGDTGRVRYRRNVKTLVGVGGKSDGTYAALTGQRLEIVPASDPLSGAAGDTLAFTLFFDSKPLAGALVKAWHRHDGQALVIRTHTGADGKARLALPFAGAWMLSAVHMTAAADTAEADWESFWSSLTFELAASDSNAPQ